GVRVPPANDPYANRQFGATDMAFDAGYREGVTLAQQDRGRNRRSDYRANTVYKSGDLGYRSSYGNRAQYQTQFRDGIARGYEDGYGRLQNNNNGTVGTGGAYPGNSNGRYQNGGRTVAGGQNSAG